MNRPVRESAGKTSNNMNVTDFSFQSENQVVTYVAPQVEIIEVQVEKGFAQSTESLQKKGFNWDEQL